MIDVGPRDVLAVYEFRRYQANIVAFAREAQARGRRIVLVTDAWRSPISAFAEVVLSVPVKASSPFDTMIPALALTKALVAAATARLADRLDERLQEIEGIRSRYRGAPDGNT